MTLEGRHVVLGVTGGIACYKSCTIARRLTQLGAAVDVVLTDAASEFVGPVTFEALTGRPVLRSLWDPKRALDHINFARNPDLVLIAPATASFLARCAAGQATDALSAILLARDGKVLVAPAMNDRMFEHPATQQNLSLLKERGWATVGPEVGELAEGPSDQPGRMSEPETIVAEAERLMATGRLSGKTVVVTAGPTRESIDDVRVVTNRSSGKMGYELADRARGHGASVVLVSGPSSLSVPHGVELRRVESTLEMETRLNEVMPHADVLIMAAAPADFRPARRGQGKLPRSEGGLTIQMEPTADILTNTVQARKPGCFVVGFALESGEGKDRARAKLERKSLDLIVYNRADEPGAGFEVETNKVTVISSDAEDDIPMGTKAEVAEQIIRIVEDRFDG